MHRARLSQVRTLISYQSRIVGVIELFVNTTNSVINRTKSEIVASTNDEEKAAWTAYLKHMETSTGSLNKINADYGMELVNLKAEKCSLKLFLKENCGGLDVTEPPMTRLLPE